MTADTARTGLTVGIPPGCGRVGLTSELGPDIVCISPLALPHNLVGDLDLALK